MLVNMALVAGGGALGSVLRVLVAAALNPRGEASGFPVGTLLVNFIGTALFGGLAAIFFEIRPVPEPIRLAVLGGVLGGFTTFSSFGYEAFSLLARGQIGLAGLYVALSNLLCIAGAAGAYRLVQLSCGR